MFSGRAFLSSLNAVLIGMLAKKTKAMKVVLVMGEYLGYCDDEG